MSEKKAYTSTDTVIARKLAAIYGTDTTIEASLNVDGNVLFTDPQHTRNVYNTQVEENLKFFGPGEYVIEVHQDHFTYARKAGMKPAQFVQWIDEALGNPGCNGTLTAIFRQQLKENKITEKMVAERAKELLEKFPIKGLTEDEAMTHVTARLAGDNMDWETFTVAMKIIGAQSITIALR